MPPSPADLLETLELLELELATYQQQRWDAIDHTDPTGTGLPEYLAFLAHAQTLAAAARTLRDALPAPAAVAPTEPAPPHNDDDDALATPTEPALPGRERTVRPLDRDTPHYLGEDFTYKRPHRFELDGQVFPGASTFREIYELVCRTLYTRDGARMRAFAGAPPFITRRGRHDFATNPQALRQPMEVAPGLWAEANLSSNHIADRLRLLLAAYALPETALRVYLHTDRDA